MNIVEPIFVQCKSKPADVAIIAPGTKTSLISYDRLARATNNICHRVIAAGIDAQRRVAVFIEDPIFHACVIIALTRLGIVTISGRAQDFNWRFSIDALIADKAFPSAAVAGRILLADADWMWVGDGRPPDPRRLNIGAVDDVCRIFLTSGTTGDEKGIAITSRNMMARIDRQNLFFGPGAPFCSRTYLDLSLTTSLGFQVLLATLWRGGALMLTGDSEMTIKALPIYKIQNMVGSPKTLVNFLNAVEKRPEYQCGLNSIFSGGSVLPEALAERVQARLCSNVTKGYGSTEATMVASMPAHFPPRVSGAVGYVLPGIAVEIVDDGDRGLRRGQEGHVRIRSRYGATEYLDDPQETDRVFREGWFYPGDLGYLTEDNVLVVSGRRTSVVNVGGEKMNPEKLEEVLTTHPNVRDCAVMANPNPTSGIDDLCALVVPRTYIDVESIREFCRDRLPEIFVPARIITVSSLPRNEMGKIDRSKLPGLLKSSLNS